jgi:hypothetical protein
MRNDKTLLNGVDELVERQKVRDVTGDVTASIADNDRLCITYELFMIDH